MKTILRQGLTATLAMTALTVLSVRPAQAAVAYLVTISTPTIAGTTGSVDFQFNPGPGSIPATAMVQNFTGGTLGPAPTSNVPSGCFATPTTTCGNVTGTLPGTVTLVNSNSLNEYLQQFTYGTTATFTLVLSGPAIDMPTAAPSGTLFCLSLFSDVPGTIQVPVANPDGCNGSVSINANGTITVTNSTGLAVVTFTPTVVPVPGAYQIGYAANLNIGDSVINLTNSGTQGGTFGAGTTGNICVNVYAFDPREEQISCCACLVTPNGLNSLSVQKDIISNNLTPDVPTSITIAMLASQPGVDPAGNFTICNPATVTPTGAAVPFTAGATGALAQGLLAWGTTLEPGSTPGTYNSVRVPFLSGGLGLSQVTAITSLCNFTQSDGSGFGICKSCRLGALGGAKK